MKLRILDPSVEIVDLLFVASETHTSFPLALVQFSLFHHLFPLTVCVCVCQSLSRVTLCDLMDCSPPGCSVHGILQGRILKWVAISVSRSYCLTVIKFHGTYFGFPSNSDGKESAYSAGGLGSIPGLGGSPGGGHVNPLSILAWRISMNRGALCASAHGVTESRT